jgi:hypothetical protein
MNNLSVHTVFSAVFAIWLILVLNQPGNAQWDVKTPAETEALIAAAQAFDEETFVAAGSQSTVIWGFRNVDGIFELKNTRITEESVSIADMHAFSPESALLIAEDGRVFISSDRGDSWQEYEIPGEELVNAGFFDESTGYAATDGGFIWRTTDGGASWTEVLSGSEAGWRTSVVISESMAVVAGTGGWYAYTSDSGESLSVEQQESVNSFAYSRFDGDIVYLVDHDSGLSTIYILSSDFSEITALDLELPQWFSLYDIQDGEILFYDHEIPVDGCFPVNTLVEGFSDNGNGWELSSSFEYYGNTYRAIRVPDSNSYLSFGDQHNFGTSLAVVSIEDETTAKAN